MKKVFGFLAVVALVGFAQVSFATNASQLKEAISVGSNLSIGLNFTPSSVNLSSSNPSVASASADSASLLVHGLSVGTTTVAVCDGQNSQCLKVTVVVTGSVLGATTYFNAHSAGTWVTQGKTVYYISSAGLIPVSTWQIFLSNGGTAAAIVPINSADLNLPLLPLMVTNDSRVK